MKRTTITFYDEVYQKLESRVIKKSSQSVAQSVRELVDLGLKVEAAAATANEIEEGNDITNALNELKDLLKSNLVWSLESRLLTRFLVENNPAKSQENKVEILETYKETAIQHVNRLVGTT